MIRYKIVPHLHNFSKEVLQKAALRIGTHQFKQPRFQDLLRLLRRAQIMQIS